MSLAGDGNTHRDQSFFDLLMFERHSIENIFNLIAKFMDALYNKWHAKLLVVSTDGENTMTAHHAGVITRLIACTDNDVLRIWCPPHQINIVVKAAAEGIDNCVSCKKAYTFSVYLCVQDNFIITMNVKCPKKTNHWAHLGRLLNFYTSYCRPLLEYPKDNRPDLMPSAIDSINVMLA
jgi:hypothetical protein